MMKILIPVLLTLMGIAGGVGIGVVMKKPVEPVVADVELEEPVYTPEKNEDSEYFELSRKLIVPVTHPRGDRYFVAIELHVEMAAGTTDKAATHEPKLRDALLRTVIAFAHTGAFDDEAHPKETFQELSFELKRAAHKVLGKDVRSVLIGDLIKQGA